ncbi:SMU1112c/YaeR family gloxylase I-like metalloprotein [Neisseria perflava]|uniref:SMU1112c/YaeR family gloxylase I-like metalloprotein n=1 Tax=Neisseria perflava TaxID=33053 RepID=UPI0020A00C63|nr:VOC family protein [Neisseria perflava]MCP1659582.1 glyoxylase I family protein [Neisseria perflava]MCP1772437.1 glyoxylase I family protein [Neisseria perflava]
MRLHHIALICADYAVSKDFYTHILGLTVLAEHYRAERDSYKLDLGIGSHYVLELFSFPNPPPRPSYPEACGLRHLAFAVDDVVTKRNRLLQSGVPCEPVRIDEYTGKEFFFCQDPDGLPIEFYQDDTP